MCLAVTYFSKTRQNKRTIKTTETLTVSFKFVWLLNLFLHTADLMPGMYTETKACGGSPPPKYERIQRIVSMYKCWLGRRPCLQFYSPTADFKKPGQLYKSPCSSPEQSIYVHTSRARAFSAYVFSAWPDFSRALRPNNGLLSTQRAWASLSSLATCVCLSLWRPLWSKCDYF